MKGWRDAVYVAPAWVAIAMVLWVTLSISSGSPGQDIVDLSGPWAAEVETGGQTWSTVIQLPGLTSHRGAPAESRVTLRKTVQAPAEGPLALWVDTPFYALEARWDGRTVGSVGDPERFGSRHRSEASLLAIVPPSSPGQEHELELVLRGDYGKSGITGHMLLGSAEPVLRHASRQETLRLSLALGLSLLAFLPLTVAAGRRGQQTYLLYGLFASSLALLSYAQSDAAADFFGDGLLLLRLKRIGEGPIAPVVIAFLQIFVHGRLNRVHQAFLAFGAFSALAGVIAPGRTLYALEIIQDASLAVGALWFIGLLIDGVRLRVQGSWLLLGMAAVPALLGVLSEVTLTHGWRSGSSMLNQSMLFLVGGTGAALMLRDALLSARHELFVSGSADAMVVVQPNGVVTDANPAAAAVLGSCIDHNLLEFITPEDHPMVRAHIQRARTQADRVEFRLGPGMDATVESLATPLEADISLLVLRDVTQRKHIDRSLIHAARMETVALLLGGIAHDFNNMLGTLLAHVGWLQARATDEAVHERIDRMEGTIDRASQLTRRLLTIARGSSAELDAVDLAAICRSSVELVEPTLGANIALEVDLPPELPPVHGDAAELEQVLVNLIVNARDALEQRGGTIRLAVRAFMLEDGARGVCAMVEDDGPGVPEEIRDEIFQPFVTTKGRGTGLGLAVASQVARDHHGRVWHEERPGGGSRFLLALRHADAVDQAPAPLPEGRRLLLVEDERVLLEDSATALRQAGYDVTAMGDPTSAARWLLAHRPDILVTDVVMDGLSGIELASLCSHRYPEVPVLLVSGFIPDESLAYSTWHRLHKPVRVARLVATVGSLRRRAERAARGEMDITRVTYLFPTLQELTATRVGLG